MQESAEPSVDISGVRIDGIGIGSTVINVTLATNNPLPVGGNIKSAEFKIYLYKKGEEIFLGEGEKENIRIEAASVTRTEIPVQLKNKAVLSAAAGLFGSDLDIIVRGTAAIDLKIAAPRIPFEKKLRIEGVLKGLSG